MHAIGKGLIRQRNNMGCYYIPLVQRLSSKRHRPVLREESVTARPAIRLAEGLMDMVDQVRSQLGLTTPESTYFPA